MTHDLSNTRGADIKTRAKRINSILSVGLADNLDVIATLQHERLAERIDSTDTTAIEYSASKWIRLVSDATLESNAERSDHRYMGSMVLGLVYSVMRNLDLDLGYRKGFTALAPDHAWLTGLALRF